MTGHKKARIVEVFSSIQGEGVRLGERQIFVRFAGCNLRCDYCDEPESIAHGSGEPWDEGSLESAILALQKGRPHRSISWTGGEPLLQIEFLGKMASWAKEQGFENCLETNGTLPEALSRVVELIDCVSMDLKLPSATRQDVWAAHEEFLGLLRPGSFVKVILTEASTAEEWERVLALMGARAPGLPLVLQPATQAGGKAQPIPPVRALEFLLKARLKLKDVRLVPQWHPVWNMK
ncbi:MAG: 7-carboxy-7-deazaguanine synthase QueE [Elusimicrobiota bacterium]